MTPHRAGSDLKTSCILGKVPTVIVISAPATLVSRLKEGAGLYGHLASVLL